MSENFNDFFDVHSIEHMQAYKYLEKTGFWPEGFIPDDCVFSHVWLAEIQARMAIAWAKQRVRTNDLLSDK